MALLLINYDLNNTKNYDALIGAIKDLGPWAHPLYSTWAVEVSMTAPSLFTHLRQFVDDDDALFVIDISRSQAAWDGIQKDASDWLANTWRRYMR